MLTQDLLHALPKTDLHVHLDGSLRIESLIEMARERGVILPSNSPDGLRELVFKPSYSSLSEYLTGFALTGAACILRYTIIRHFHITGTNSSWRLHFLKLTESLLLSLK